jgi:predicted GNAT family acetyltransferase
VPVLDFFVVLRNSVLVLCVSDVGEVLSFVSVKKHGSSYELGTVYTYPQHRSKGYASELIAHVLQRYQPI